MWHIFLLRFILASTYTIGKASLAAVKPIFFVGTRMTISGLLLLTWCWFKRSVYTIQKQDRWLFVQLALLQIYVPYVIEFCVLHSISSTKWALIHAASPFVTALFAWFILHELLTSKKWLGLAIGVLGFLSIFLMQDSPVMIDTVSYGWPELAITFSMIIYSYSWIIAKQLVPRYNPAMINGIIMASGGLLSLVTSAIWEPWHASPVYAMPSYLLLLLLSIVVTIAAFPAYLVLLKRYSATFLSFSGFLEPLFVAMLGWFLLAEIVSSYFVFAIGLLTAGLYVFYKEETNLKIIETSRNLRCF